MLKLFQASCNWVDQAICLEWVHAQNDVFQEKPLWGNSNFVFHATYYFYSYRVSAFTKMEPPDSGSISFWALTRDLNKAGYNCSVQGAK